MNTSALPLSKRLSLIRKDTRAVIPNRRPRVEFDTSLTPIHRSRRVVIKRAAAFVLSYCMGWLTASFLTFIGVL